jgi:HlyD family secretion protein
MTPSRLLTVVGAVLLIAASPAGRASVDAELVQTAHRGIRLHGVVEPIRSYTVSAPRLTGATSSGGPGQLIVVRLARAGTSVNAGDVLVEFDRHNQLKSARDRESEYRDILEQINKKKGEQLAARGMRNAQLQQAANDVRIAELGVVGNDLVAKATAEKNVQTLEEAQARHAQLKTTFELRAKAEAADLRILELQRDRAANAWQHAQRNAEKMRVVAPHAGLIVLNTIWKNGTMAEVQEGEEVRPGIPILDVVDPSAMRVRVNANQADIEALSVGQGAAIRLDSYPSKTFTGRLETVSPIAIASSMSPRVRTFVAVFSIEGSDPHLLPDLAAAVEVAPKP